jgi:hypothetical protein
VAKHEQPEDPRARYRRLARHALHPFTHIAALIGLHLVAVTILEKTPLIDLLLH